MSFENGAGITMANLLISYDDSRKGFVEFPHRDLLFRYPGALERNWHRFRRRDGEVDRIDGGVGGGDDPGEYAALAAVLLCDISAPQHQRRGAIVERGRVRGRDSASFVDEGRFEGGHFFDAEVLVAFVLGDDRDVALFPLYRDWSDFVVKFPFGPCLLRSSEASDGVLVLLFPGDVVFLYRFFRADAHMDLIIYVP